jgi:hypothetical protein
MQQFLVIVLVVFAALVSVWKLMPARRRLRLLLALDTRLARHDLFAGWRARVLAKRIQAAAGHGCSGCAANVGIPRHPR